jgi:hypothetical protein
MEYYKAAFDVLVFTFSRILTDTFRDQTWPWTPLRCSLTSCDPQRDTQRTVKPPDRQLLARWSKQLASRRINIDELISST